MTTPTHIEACAFADTSTDPIAEMLRNAYVANESGDQHGVSLFLHGARLAYAFKALSEPAALAVTGEMVEAGAVALVKHDWNGTQPEDWNRKPPGWKVMQMDRARAVLTAALAATGRPDQGSSQGLGGHPCGERDEAETERAAALAGGDE